MKQKAIITFVYFLVCAALIGGVFALLNQLAWHYGMESKAVTYVFAVIMAYCMYRLWRWLCRRLDKMGKKD